MEALRNLLVRYGAMGVLIFVGCLLIVYAGLIIIFMQQDTKQVELEGQIERTSAIIAKPMSDASELEAEYQDVLTKLEPLTRDEAIALLVGIAAKHGVDVGSEAGGLVIPPASIETGPGTIGDGNYQVMSFDEISIQSSYENVIALINDLDSGATMETMVLTGFVILSLEGTGGDPGGDAERLVRAAEFDLVQTAVRAMMAANNLNSIPNPVSEAIGIASNNMAAFPDPFSGWLGSPGGKTFDARGGSYGAGDAIGYVLIDHDDAADGSTGGRVDYIGLPRTEYFYTCETDGTISQFPASDLSGEEPETAPSDVSAVLSVDIYSLKSEVAE